MKQLSLIILLCCSVAMHAQSIIESTRSKLRSPDGRYEFEFYQKQISEGVTQMYYSVSYEGKDVIKESQLGVLIHNQLFESALAVPNDTTTFWCENLALMAFKSKSVNDVWKPVYGESSDIKDNYNECTLEFQKGDSKGEHSVSGYDKRRCYKMNLVVRAYNEGIAFRYFFPETDNGLFIHIVGEQTQFSMPEGTLGYYERWAQGPYSLLPLKNWMDESERPLTMKLTNGLYVTLGEAEMVDFARMKFRLAKENTLQASLYSSVDIITPYATPWRIIMAAEKPADLIANKNIVLNLNPKNKIEDTSWIKPGKAVRVGRLAQVDALKYIDFAAERGLQYIHLDAGWYGPEMKMSSNATSVSETKDLNIPALTAYAASKGIGVWVYVNQRALVQQLDSILPLYKKWGVKGIKFGFVQIGNQHWSTWLHDAIRKCAEYQILVDVHDEYRPTGFSRTYPNLLTQEGVRGNEEMPDAAHNVTLPFTRFLAGAADYTICYYNNRIKTTHGHQLAMPVVFYSPLQFLYWYDAPTSYNGEPEIEFFDKVKTVWDETKTVDGKIGEYITVARRSGKEWFVGTMTGNDGRRLSTPLLFLNEKQKYVANIYTDDDLVETKTKVRVSRLIVDNKTTLDFLLKPSGGCAIYFVPATKQDLKKYKSYKKKQVL